MDINDLIQDKLINIAKKDLDYKEVIKYLGKTLLNNEYIKKQYINDVLTREESFPTGLELKNMGIAIPHANPDNVLKNGISILKLKNPVRFSNMETGDHVYVSIAFMLALKDPNDHLKMLQSLFIMFQKEKVMDELINASNKDEIKRIMLNNLM
ncbi:MAG: PTS sugar transporter subunit IIA [Clostridium sp.]|jgi:PTS system galactitol-specific IIA component|uniref:PTS sugar transporter subunit IIA n=1 Tax=Clostridium sp. TaxID=1506 RepID=UPI0025C18F71|nr:PTS sugar transporter subunit IIA [Clostridium sp.]MCH3965950.1 PTS sugar transporter subunit IIA [Clostridium sp.]MCI1715961.1 PTS sugar transporter subunit IIA [Clostridium sp.]MCI1800367.1 PTS sugar transporter subunit IIA [Clostridium sp.]MCI1814138.1 PTS sugar transporter subunit IIA [Clostridium sp.]MCI1871037.1 PTS sugar transporter subunit IIA [Clostridium sp.]